jgi:hypothetical protein
MTGFECRIRKSVSAIGFATGLAAFGCISLRADSITPPAFASMPGGSGAEFTNGNLLTVLSFTPAFEQFDPTLASGSATVPGINDETAPFSADDSSINSGDTSTLSFGYTPPGIAPPARPEVSSVVYLATMVTLLAVGLLRRRRSRAPVPAPAPVKAPAVKREPKAAAAAAGATLPFGASSGTQEI